MTPLLAAILLTVCGQAPEDDSGWTNGPELPEPVQELHAAPLRGRIYVAGGIRSGNVVSSSVFRLDSAAMQWTRVADLPASRHHMPLAATTDSLYAIGGFDPTGSPVATVWVYDEEGDRWLERAPLPEPRAASAAAVVGDGILVVGGVGAGNVLLDSIAIYDRGAGGWTRGTPIPTPRDHLAAVVLGGALYAVGGGRSTRTATSTAGNATTCQRLSGRRSPRCRPLAAGWGRSPPAGVSTPSAGRPPAECSRSTRCSIPVRVAGVPQHRCPLHGTDWPRRSGGRIYVIGGGPRAGLAQTAVVETFFAP